MKYGWHKPFSLDEITQQNRQNRPAQVPSKTGSFPHRSQVDYKLIFTVKIQQPIYQNLIISSHGAGAGPNGLTGLIQILTHVPSIQKNYSVSGNIITPLHAIRYGSPNKNYRGVCYPVLLETCSGNFQR